MKNKVFMKCNWENLVYINYCVEPSLIEHLLPRDIELDLYQGRAIISFVCFKFSNTKIYGIKMPFHQDFPEINIRTYVKSKRYKNKKGIYFISEMVPDFMTYFVGKFIYKEPFSVFPIENSVAENYINYTVKSKNFNLEIQLETNFKKLSREKSEEQQFVIDREYAFCGKKDGSSKIYQVKHQDWNLLEVENPKILINQINHLDKNLHQKIMNSHPLSSYMTDGSSVKVIKNLD